MTAKDAGHVLYLAPSVSIVALDLSHLVQHNDPGKSIGTPGAWPPVLGGLMTPHSMPATRPAVTRRRHLASYVPPARVRPYVLAREREQQRQRAVLARTFRPSATGPLAVVA